MGSGAMSSPSFLRVLRLFRLTRMARMARLLRACPELFVTRIRHRAQGKRRASAFMFGFKTLTASCWPCFVAFELDVCLRGDAESNRSRISISDVRAAAAFGCGLRVRNCGFARTGGVLWGRLFSLEGVPQGQFATGSGSSCEGVSIGYLWAVESVQPLELQLKRPMPAQFFTQLLDGKAKQSGDIAYDNFRTVAALWRRTTSFAVS